MFADADHEVIESPEALYRHLYEEHGVEEARELDPETAPLQFWLRRHAELERAQRAARRQPDPPAEPTAPAAEPREAGTRPTSRSQAAGRSRVEGRSQAPPGPRGPVRPEGGGAGRDGRRPAGFGDPLVEAVARTLAGRGYDEATVRTAIRSFAAADDGPTGEAAIRAAFVEPMLQSVAEHLLGAGSQRPPARSQPSTAPPARPAANPAPAPTAGPPADQAPGPPADQAPGPPAREEPARPEAAWAVLWADLAETGRRPGDDGATAAEDRDDLMAVANAVQARRRVRLLRR
jgi:hypothetical protein